MKIDTPIIGLIDADLEKLRQIEIDLKGLSLTSTRDDLLQALKLIAGQIAAEEASQAHVKRTRDFLNKEHEEQKEIARQRAIEMGINFPFYDPNKQD